jgi:hypothetical protein
MPITLTVLPLPELAAWLLVAGIPLISGLLVWPLLRPAQRPLPEVAPPEEPDRHLGLPGQWLVQNRNARAWLDRHQETVRLHRRAANHLGNLDHEIDRLWRDTRAILTEGAASGRPI